MPVAAAAQQVVQALIGNGYNDVDFAALLELRGARPRGSTSSPRTPRSGRAGGGVDERRPPRRADRG